MQVQVVEKRAKSVDIAIKSALDELGCEIDDVLIEIIDEGSKGLLGIIGNKPALVKVSLRERPEQDTREIVETILGKMGINYEIEKLNFENDIVRINFIGADMGLLIGRKGETLNALQFLTGLIINRHRENKIRVVLDVEDYRLKREQSLEALALRLAEKVKKTHKNVIMRPMTSPERRIVHTALQGDSDIVTYSMGEDPHRKVVISLKK